MSLGLSFSLVFPFLLPLPCAPREKEKGRKKKEKTKKRNENRNGRAPLIVGARLAVESQQRRCTGTAVSRPWVGGPPVMIQFFFVIKIFLLVV